MKKYELSEVIITVVLALAVVCLIAALVCEVVNSDYTLAALATVGIVMSLGMPIAMIISDIESKKKMRGY